MLLDAKGNPISSSSFRRAAAPPKGEAFATWGSNEGELIYGQLPGGGVVQFDLSRLTIQDFRAMRDHYQVNASLAVLTFMQHQSDWHIECENKAIADECEYQLRNIWTSLNRAMGSANWAGYSPNILQWENDKRRPGKTVLTKVKDIVPEVASVNWEEVDGWMPPEYSGGIKPKIKVYNGIKQLGTPWPIPRDNTFWYPLLMENNNYTGRRLLKAAFVSWYFSTLIHLFANRYYERYGEPLVVGRAPFENDIKDPITGEVLNGQQYMLQVISDLRSRSAVSLPDDKTEMSNGRMEFDYNIQYLESQMRGADWERYLTRLDEEISIGLFTPILLLRTADVGSYNLGVGHMQMYLWMLNAMNDDRAQYIDKFILSRMTDFNFSPSAPRPRIKFRKMGNQNSEIVKTIVEYLVSNNRVKFDIREIGEIAGMSMEEIDQTLAKDEPWGEDNLVSADGGDGTPPGSGSSAPGDGLATGRPRSTAADITARVAGQVQRAFASGAFDPAHPIDMGYRRQMINAFNGIASADQVFGMYSGIEAWLSEVTALPLSEWGSSEEFMRSFQSVLDENVNNLLGG